MQEKHAILDLIHRQVASIAYYCKVIHAMANFVLQYVEMV